MKSTKWGRNDQQPRMGKGVQIPSKATNKNSQTGLSMDKVFGIEFDTIVEPWFNGS
jgi:hypothetical protein